MSEARRCDRCNEYYMINEDVKKRGEYPITAGFKKQIYSLSIYDNNNSRITHKDLCPKCSRSLIVWLNDWGQYEETVNTIDPPFIACPYLKSKIKGLACAHTKTCKGPCELVNKMNMEVKDCKDCKHDELCDNAFTENDPCNSCDNFDNFEPKEDSE